MREIHLPDVKSGIATGIPPVAIDCSESAEMHISDAISYASIGIGRPSLTHRKKSLYTR